MLATALSAASGVVRAHSSGEPGTPTICNGVHSRGVYGAVCTLTDAAVCDGNERYLSTAFGDARSFAILMSVPVIKNRTITPDFNSPGAFLYR